MKTKANIEVRKKWGCNELYINGFAQSTSAYRQDWYKILKKAGVLGLSDQRVLLLGLGGGDLVKLLTTYHTNVMITAVELEPSVIQVARDSFGVTESESLTIVVGDAQAYMQTNRATYDVVIVDLYDGDTVPSFVPQPAFLSAIARSLCPGGQAIFNYASHSFNEYDFVSFEKKLRRIFASVEQKKIWGHTFYLVRDVIMARLKKSARPGATLS